MNDTSTDGAAVAAPNFADAKRMSEVANKAAAIYQARREGTSTDTLTMDELPWLLQYFVTVGILSAEQAEAILHALTSGDPSQLPDLPSQGYEYLYDAFKTAMARQQGTESTTDDVVEAIIWIVEHAPAIVHAVQAVGSALSDLWHWVTG